MFYDEDLEAEESRQARMARVKDKYFGSLLKKADEKEAKERNDARFKGLQMVTSL